MMNTALKTAESIMLFMAHLPKTDGCSMPRPWVRCQCDGHHCRVMPRVYSGRLRYTWGCGTWGRDIVLLARPDQGRLGAWRRRRVADTYHAMAGPAPKTPFTVSHREP